GDQQVFPRAEVVLQGADRDRALGGYVGEAGGVRAPLRDHPPGRFEHLDLAAPGAADPAAPGPHLGLGHAAPSSTPDPGAGSGTGRGPSAKKAGSRQRATSISAAPASSEPA